MSEGSSSVHSALCSMDCNESGSRSIPVPRKRLSNTQYSDVGLLLDSSRKESCSFHDLDASCGSIEPNVARLHSHQTTSIIRIPNPLDTHSMCYERRHRRLTEVSGRHARWNFSSPGALSAVDRLLRQDPQSAILSPFSTARHPSHEVKHSSFDQHRGFKLNPFIARVRSSPSSSCCNTTLTFPRAWSPCERRG